MHSIRKLANLGLRRASVLGCRQAKSFCTEDEVSVTPFGNRSRNAVVIDRIQPSAGYSVA